MNVKHNISISVEQYGATAEHAQNWFNDVTCSQETDEGFTVAGLFRHLFPAKMEPQQSFSSSYLPTIE